MRVVKLGGRAQGDPRLSELIRSSRDTAKGRFVVVHGGGDEISTLQNALGRKPQFIDGRRVTTADDLQVLRMVLSGAINKRLVSALNHSGVPAVGLSGEDGQLIGARSGAGKPLGEVGIPEKINVSLLTSVMEAGYLPVISPVGYDLGAGETGALNVNGDDAAAAIAAALAAEELLFVADVEGVIGSAGSVLDFVESAEIEQLVQSGVARGGMNAKLDAARTALSAGVGKVRITDLAGITDLNRGTTITLSPVTVK
jgi:acetylglutamate kinase